MITVDELVALIKREMRGKMADAMVIDEDTVIGQLGLSSLQVAEIVFTLEEDHGVEFDAGRAASATTLGDLIKVGNEAIEAAAAH